LRFVLFWLGGVDLRLTLLAVPPVLPLIHRQLGLSEFGVAALTNVPVLLLSVAAIPGSLAIARWGARGALIGALWLIAIAAALRGAGPSIAMLFTATIVMGAGIAMAQTSLPTLVRAWYPDRIALATSVWANGLLCGEALSASLTIPLILPWFGGAWEPAVAVWSIPVALTAIAVALVPAPPGVHSGGAMRWLPDFRDARVWRIGVFQSAASLAYFGANTFIPDYLHAVGRPELVGGCLAALNIGQLPASLIIGIVPLRELARRRTSSAFAVLIAGALATFVFIPAGVAAITASAVFGFAGAYILAFSFALPAFLAAGPDVARVSAGTFTIGYAIAFVTTVFAGALWDASHQPALAFLPILGAAAIVLALGPRLGRAALASDMGT
jgi:CP family cyanate transporter-like MFS transporter